MTASMEPERDELRLMAGAPPFTPERLVTLAGHVIVNAAGGASNALTYRYT